VQVGTASFARPFAMVEIVRTLQQRCTDDRVTGIRDLIDLWRAQ